MAQKRVSCAFYIYNIFAYVYILLFCLFFLYFLYFAYFQHIADVNLCNVLFYNVIIVSFVFAVVFFGNF